MEKATQKIQKRGTTYLRDYQASAFLIDRIQLEIELEPSHTRVKSRLFIRPNPSVSRQNILRLDGEELELQGLWINGESLQDSDYELEETQLLLTKLPDEAFELATEVLINPEENTKLMGLYVSKGNFCTQCESNGFRYITYFIDRPDILTYFETKIIADKTHYPFLLSNGNLLEQGDLPDGRHWVKWQDPSLKPCYLFALVAGQYERLEDHFITCSKRKVILQVYVELGKLSQADHAMDSLKRAMRWDEEIYGCEYDLDLFMIVAVSDFNYGAMENKGLNIFNSCYILANPKTATDQNYTSIESVIAHEYFHNWSGNRVTCRDWFQITLKEGLTVFRDQNFTADQTDPVVERISDANVIRNLQFAEDAGPMAHPIQPQSYMAVNNFYTLTVYNKGAEVIRMLHTLLGKKHFHTGMSLYFKRHDGQAVTTEEFVKAMEDASGVDLKQFRRWYWQAGTPHLKLSGHYDVQQKTYTLDVHQSCPETADGSEKKPFMIPLAVGLVGESGQAIPLHSDDMAFSLVDQSTTSGVLTITQPEQRFCFTGVREKPVPSLLRHFSAPVICTHDESEHDLLLLLAHDEDKFNRWQAGQSLFASWILKKYEAMQASPDQMWHIPEAGIKAWKGLLQSKQLEPSFISCLWFLPTEHYLISVVVPGANILQLHRARCSIRHEFATALREELLELYQSYPHQRAYQFNRQQVGERCLKNTALHYLLELDETDMHKLAWEQFERSDNMTDQLAALSALNDSDTPLRQKAMDAFYQAWCHEDLVLYKWFNLQSSSRLPYILERVKSLMAHKSFNKHNPNCVRTILGGFAGNLLGFHAEDGGGYYFLAEQIIAIDVRNANLAASLVRPLTQWEKFDTERQARMREALQYIADQGKHLSSDLHEIVYKSLPR